MCTLVCPECGHWLRLNFPTTAEKAFAMDKGMPA